jgi:hypothetical protein
LRSKYLRSLAHPTRFERVTFAFGGQRSIQLSYGCNGVHLADWSGVGNGLWGAGRGRSKAPKAAVTRSNRVGCARKACAGRAGTVAGYFSCRCRQRWPVSPVETSWRANELSRAALVQCFGVMSDSRIDRLSRGKIIAPHAPQVEKFLEKSTRNDEPKPPIRHPLRSHQCPTVSKLDPVAISLDRAVTGD